MKSFRRLRVVAFNTYLESVRQKVFVGLVFFGFLLLAASLVLKDISVHQDLKILEDIGLACAEFFGTLIAVFIGVDLIGRDIERRTLHLLVVKPLTRSEFVVGRYLGLCLTVLTSVLLMMSGLAGALLIVGGRFSIGLAFAFFTMFLQLMVTAAASTFLSAASSHVLALLGASILCLLGRMSAMLKNASLILDGFPDWLGQGLYVIVPNLLAFDLKTRAVYGDPIPISVLVSLTGYAAVCIGVLLTMAVIVFERRDLK